jgi:hypothetical protein
MRGRDTVESLRVDWWFMVSVEHLGRKIQTIRPYDRPCILIDTHLGEVLGVVQLRGKAPSRLSWQTFWSICPRGADRAQDGGLHRREERLSS